MPARHTPSTDAEYEECAFPDDPCLGISACPPCRRNEERSLADTGVLRIAYQQARHTAESLARVADNARRDREVRELVGLEEE